MAVDLGDLRTELEVAAQDGSVSADVRLRSLREIRAEAVGILGLADTYIGDLEKYRTGGARVSEAELEQVRVNADWRETLLQEGTVSEGELDALGLLSHDELDRLAEEGLLQEAASGLVRKAGKFLADLHPRDRLGRWADKPGQTSAAPSRPRPESFKLRQTNVGDHWEAVGPDGMLALRPSKAEAAAELEKMKSTVAANYEKRRQARKGKGKADPGKPDTSGGKADPGKPTDTKPYEAEPAAPAAKDPVELEEARSLILSGKPTSRDLYSTERNGRRVYDKSRQLLHKRIIETLFTQDAKGATGKGARKRRPKGRKPQVFFTGGGFASGKGGIVDGFGDQPPHRWRPQMSDGPDGAVVIDADKIKALLPEFGELQKAGDPEANVRVYEEAWDVAQQAIKQAQTEGLDSIVDGVGNTSLDEVKTKVQSFIDAGYDTPKAVYVTKDVEGASKDAMTRMQKAMEAGKLESIRYVPPDMLREVHGRVAETFPSIAKWWPGELELYTTLPRLADGSFAKPALTARKLTGDEAKGKADPGAPKTTTTKDGLEVIEPTMYEQFLDRKRFSKRGQ